MNKIKQDEAAPLQKMKRNVYIGKKRTTLAFEAYIWKLLDQIAAQESMTIDELCTEIDKSYNGDETISTVLRYLGQEMPRLRKSLEKNDDSTFADTQLREEVSHFPSILYQVLDNLNQKAQL